MRFALVVLLVAAGCADDRERTLFNQSTAALRAGDLVVAEIAAEKAAAHGGPLAWPRRDFIRGNAAFVRCDREELKAYGPAGGVRAIDAALRFAEQARDAWTKAAASRENWPEARRNVERAILKIQKLRAMKEEAESKPNEPPPKKPQPLPAAESGEPQDPGTERRPAPRARATTNELTPEQVAALMDRLAEKEREKVRVRRADQQARRAQVERDW